MNKIQNWELQQKQSLPLDIKIEMTKARIRQWYEGWLGEVYVSFSGGKDSTVLLHLVRSLYPDVPAVYVDTGLEYPEIRDFVKQTENVKWLKPQMNFKKVIEHYGYPVVSKEQSQYIQQYRNAKSEKTKNTRLYGDKNGGFKISEKWKYLLDAPFKISDQCCNVMKKNPIKKFEKETGLKPYIGTMASESIRRKTNYLKFGCNAFDAKCPTSRPLSFWTDDDIWAYMKQFNVHYSKIYDMGYDRTGCMFCMFGVHLEKGENRFQRMAVTHPKQYDYCINKLGCGKVLDYIGVDYKVVS